MRRFLAALCALLIATPALGQTISPPGIAPDTIDGNGNLVAPLAGSYCFLTGQCIIAGTPGTFTVSNNAKTAGGLLSVGSFRNFLTGTTTTLNGAIDNVVTTLVLTSAANFPIEAFINIDSESMRVTATSGNTLTVIRGRLGTLAASHSDMAVVSFTRSVEGQNNTTAVPARVTLSNGNNGFGKAIPTQVVDVVGNIQLTGGVIAAGTPPTITGTCTTGSQVGGTTAGSFAATCITATVILALPTAPNGWACNFHDLTTPTDTLNQTAYSASSCTASGTTVAADSVVFNAVAF